MLSTLSRVPEPFSVQAEASRQEREAHGTDAAADQYIRTCGGAPGPTQTYLLKVSIRTKVSLCALQQQLRSS